MLDMDFGERSLRYCPKRVVGACSVELRSAKMALERSVYRPNPRSERCSGTFSDSLYSITYAERLAEQCPPGAFGERNGYKDAQYTPEGSQKWAKCDVAERDNAK